MYNFITVKRSTSTVTEQKHVIKNTRDDVKTFINPDSVMQWVSLTCTVSFFRWMCHITKQFVIVSLCCRVYYVLSDSAPPVIDLKRWNQGVSINSLINSFEAKNIYWSERICRTSCNIVMFYLKYVLNSKRMWEQRIQSMQNNNKNKQIVWDELHNGTKLWRDRI